MSVDAFSEALSGNRNIGIGDSASIQKNMEDKLATCVIQAMEIAAELRLDIGNAISEKLKIQSKLAQGEGKVKVIYGLNNSGISENINKKEAAPAGRMMNETQAAAYIGFTAASIRKSRSTGILAGTACPPFQKVGKRVVYSSDQLDLWLSQFPQMQSTSDYITPHVDADGGKKY